MPNLTRTFFFALLLPWLGACVASSTKTEWLVSAGSVPLPDVTGRIDHLAYRHRDGRLLVAALAAGRVLAVDLATQRVAAVAQGLPEPQGIALLPSGDAVAVACGGDGTLRVLNADSLAPLAQQAVGGDADNVRIDAARQILLVGVQDGLFVAPIADLRAGVRWPLAGHAESFQIDEPRNRVYVNVPDASAVVALDLATGRTVGSVRPSAARNYPMALDAARGVILVGCREPASIVVLAQADLRELQRIAAPGDLDDLFVDAARQRLYAIGGEGYVDAFAIGNDGTLTLRQRLSVAPGARTGLWVPERSELWIAVPQQGSSPAEVRCVRVAGG